MKSGPNSCVYMVEAINGMIKIGVSTNAEKRALSILTASPIKTRLIATFPGSYKDELRVHTRFNNFRAWGEWFYPEGELAAFVVENRWNGADPIEWADIKWRQCQDSHSASANEKRSAAMKAVWAVPGFREQAKQWFKIRKQLAQGAAE